MPVLAEMQTRIRDALLTGGHEHVAPFLLGGTSATKRFAIHQRHYEASLAAALLTKFPGCVWLLGSSSIAEAARAFVHEHPPAAPCIAEYGAEFASFLANRPVALRVPYLRSFAELEWHLGQIAIAIDLPAASPAALAAINPDLLPDAVIELQPGARYFAAPWPVDELIELFLSEGAPRRLEFSPMPVALELRGARGVFKMRRLDGGTFAFRATVANGTSIGAAAERAWEADPDFDPGRALAGLISDSLVTGVAAPSAGVPS